MRAHNGLSQLRRTQGSPHWELNTASVLSRKFPCTSSEPLQLRARGPRLSFSHPAQRNQRSLISSKPPRDTANECWQQKSSLCSWKHTVQTSEELKKKRLERQETEDVWGIWGGLRTHLYQLKSIVHTKFSRLLLSLWLIKTSYNCLICLWLLPLIGIFFSK